MFLALLLLLLILINLLTNLAVAERETEGSFEKQCRTSSCKHPLVNDPDLNVKLLYQIDIKFQPNQLSPVSTMTFLGEDILILNKNNGAIYREWYQPNHEDNSSEGKRSFGAIWSKSGGKSGKRIMSSSMVTMAYQTGA